MAGADGAQDISGLFSRVSALEQDEMSSETELIAVSKGYTTIGIRVRVRYWTHQYPIAGDTNPLFGPILGQTFI